VGSSASSQLSVSSAAPDIPSPPRRTRRADDAFGRRCGGAAHRHRRRRRARPATRPGEGRAPADYTTFLDTNALRGARLGVVRKMFGRNEHVARVMEEALTVMKKLGAELIDPVELETQGKFDDAELQVLLYEFKDGLNRYWRRSGPRLRTRPRGPDRVQRSNRDREMPTSGRRSFCRPRRRSTDDEGVQRCPRAVQADVDGGRHRQGAALAHARRAVGRRATPPFD